MISMWKCQPKTISPWQPRRQIANCSSLSPDQKPPKRPAWPTSRASMQNWKSIESLALFLSYCNNPAPCLTLLPAQRTSLWSRLFKHCSAFPHQRWPPLSSPWSLSNERNRTQQVFLCAPHPKTIYRNKVTIGCHILSTKMISDLKKSTLEDHTMMEWLTNNHVYLEVDSI